MAPDISSDSDDEDLHEIIQRSLPSLEVAGLTDEEDEVQSAAPPVTARASKFLPAPKQYPEVHIAYSDDDERYADIEDSESEYEEKAAPVAGKEGWQARMGRVAGEVLGNGPSDSSDAELETENL